MDTIKNHFFIILVYAILFPLNGFAQLEDSINTQTTDELESIDIIGSEHNSLENASEQIENSQINTPEKETPPPIDNCKDADSSCLKEPPMKEEINLNGIEPPYSNLYKFKRAEYNKKFVIKNVFTFHIIKKWAYPKVIWFHIHNNESDAKESLLWAVSNIGGYGLYLDNTGYPLQRNIRFRVPSIGEVEMDPNRMFTQRGMSGSLKVLNRKIMSVRWKNKKIYNYTWKNISKPSTKIILRYWNKNRPLVALHNNRILTINDYSDSLNYEVSIADSDSLGNFVFTTKKSHYDILKKNNFNVVRQKKLAHDGSLSDYAFLKKLPYINIETRIDNPEIQKKLTMHVAYLLFPNQFDSSQKSNKKEKK